MSVVDPQRVVQRVMHLQLKQVIISRRVPHDSDVTDSIAQTTVVGIEFVFGNIPGDDNMLRMPSPAEPRFVIVHEELLQGGENQVKRIDRAVGTVSTRRGKIYGPWELEVELPDKRLSLSVESNADEQSVREIGDGITDRQQR